MSRVTIQEYEVSEFKGAFPEVPTAAGVDMDALRAQDADLMMVSLPIIPRIGATSRNGLLYDETLADSIVTQINAKRPEGIFGHVKDEERSTAYPEPAAIWVGAKKDGDQVWAKAVITDPAAKQRIRRLKATGGQIATSIYGKGAYEATDQKGVRRLTSFDLESLDFAPPARAALQNGAYPVITAETTQEENPEMTREELIAELTAGDIPATIREQIIAEHGQRNSQASTIAELQQRVSDTTALLSEAQTTIAEYRRTAFVSDIKERVSELTNWPVTGDEAKGKLAAFRRTLQARIVAELGEEREEDKVAETVQAVWDDLKPLAETLRDSLTGGHAIIGGKGRSHDKRQLEDTPEARRKARAQFNF